MRVLSSAIAACTLAGLCTAGLAVAQQQPKQCQPAAAPQKVDGKITEMDKTSGRLRVQDKSGASHEFQASQETVRDLKVGDNIEATLRPLPKC
jgi:hypothetical protein